MVSFTGQFSNFTSIDGVSELLALVDRQSNGALGKLLPGNASIAELVKG